MPIRTKSSRKRTLNAAPVIFSRRNISLTFGSIPAKPNVEEKQISKVFFQRKTNLKKISTFDPTSNFTGFPKRDHGRAFSI